MDTENLMKTISYHQNRIREFKKIKKEIIENEGDVVGFNIVTKVFTGNVLFNIPVITKVKSKLNISVSTMLHLLDVAIKNETEAVDKLLNEEMKNRKQQNYLRRKSNG